MAFADKKAAFAYVNEYQKEKYDRITVMAGKGKKAMTAREVLNLSEWLKSKGFTSDKMVDCIESVEGKKKIDKEEKED